MAFSLLTPQPAKRDASLNYDDIGPGLYEDETALVLDDGSLVAVSVVPMWLANGAGVAFTGYARLMNADGSTMQCAFGNHVETNLNHSADALTVQSLGVETIAREIMLAMLGEEPTLRDVDGEQHPLIGWGEEFRANVSIRAAKNAVATTGPLAINPANILGL